MTRLVLFSQTAQLDNFPLEAGDRLVPLNDAAIDDLEKRGLVHRMADLPDLGPLQAESLSEAFETAKAILAALDGDLSWRKILCYKRYDLRPMALKNLFFALEDVARVYRLAMIVRAAHPGSQAILLDDDPVIRRAVGLPDSRALLAVPLQMRQRMQPILRFGRDRWQMMRAKQDRLAAEASNVRPVIVFLDAPHRARLMARTLALLAEHYPIHNARLYDWSWPADLSFFPADTYAWNAYPLLGSAARIARHVLASRAGTRLEAFDIPGRAWLPPHLLWMLRYDDIQRYANMIEALEGLARAQHPALWITLEDLFAFGKCAAAVGEKYGIPTLNVQHGIIGAYPYRTGVDVVGTFAAFGEASRQTLIERGADPARIVVTGPVRYDDILELKPDREAMLREEHLDPVRPVILFASQPTRRLITPAVKRLALRALLEGAGQIGVQVIIKTHPLEDDPVLDEVLAEFDQHVPIVREQLYEWLLISDIMATISSTVVYEAAMAERPALVLEWSGNSDVAGYREQGIAHLPESPEQTGDAIRRLLADESVRAAMLAQQRAFVQHHLAGNDGKASERLAVLARRLIEEGT